MSCIRHIERTGEAVLPKHGGDRYTMCGLRIKKAAECLPGDISEGSITSPDDRWVCRNCAGVNRVYERKKELTR